MVCDLDLRVFSGDFRCCSSHHVESPQCDRERLRTPMLGIYADYLRQVLSHQGSAVSSGMAQLLGDWILQDTEQMFPRSFEFATASTATMTSSVQVRELFGPLPEMLEKRIRSADATIKTSSAVLGRAGGPGVRQAQQAGTQSCGAAQKPATLEKGGRGTRTLSSYRGRGGGPGFAQHSTVKR